MYIYIERERDIEIDSEIDRAAGPPRKTRGLVDLRSNVEKGLATLKKGSNEGLRLADLCSNGFADLRSNGFALSRSKRQESLQNVVDVDFNVEIKPHSALYRIRGNWGTGFLDYILPYTPGGFRRFRRCL